MPSITFKVSDNQKYNFLWSLLNPNCNEEGGWVVEYALCDIYDDYAIAYSFAEGIYERVYYTKDDTNDSVAIDRKERCYIIDVTENEKKALDALHALNGDTYEQVDEKFSSIEGLNQKISENDAKIEELNNTISTLTTERDDANTQKETAAAEAETTYNALKGTYDELVAANAELNTKYEALVTYKKNIEDAEKMAIIDSYRTSLSEDVLNQYIADKDNYTAEDLDMKLTYVVKKTHPELFSNQSTPAYVPNDTEDKSGLESILSKYENKH